MKIAIIMGRGIEGCGVTKFTVEQTKWLAKNGHEFTVFSSKDKSWTRKNAHDVSNVIQLKLQNPEETNNLIAGCNAADVVIINSLPSIGHPEECITQFKRALNEITTPIVLIQHDHSSLSIKRNAAINESIGKAGILFGHSSTNDFARFVESSTGGGALAGFFDDDNSKTIKNFQPGMDFDSIRAKYWLPIEQTNPIMHKWIGRTTSWKGYVQMFKFHNEFLRQAGYITTFEGIEKSPAYIDFRNLSVFNPHLTDKITNIELKINEPVYVFGPYINDEMLHRMAQCGFGYQLSLLDARYIERSMEYTHCEVVCTGVVPVFRKGYGERCTHRKFGDKLINCKNTGTIWLDDNDMQPAYELLNKLAKDSVMRNEYREMAFEFYKQHQDSQYTFAEMMKKLDDNL